MGSGGSGMGSGDESDIYFWSREGLLHENVHISRDSGISQGLVRSLAVSSDGLVPEHFDFPPVAQDWVIKGLGMSSRICVTG